MFDINEKILLWAIGALLITGGFYATVLWRLRAIEKLLGNGSNEGVYVRKEILELMKKEADKDHEIFRRQINTINGTLGSVAKLLDLEKINDRLDFLENQRRKR